MKETHWIADGLEGKSFGATLKLYVTGIAVVTILALFAGTIWGDDATFYAAPLFVLLAVAYQYWSIHSRDGWRLRLWKLVGYAASSVILVVIFFDLARIADFFTERILGPPVNNVQAAVQTADDLAEAIAEARAKKKEAPSGYFLETSGKLDMLAGYAKDEKLRNAVENARIRLADYRSALLPPPKAKTEAEKEGPPDSMRVHVPGAYVYVPPHNYRIGSHVTAVRGILTPILGDGPGRSMFTQTDPESQILVVPYNSAVSVTGMTFAGGIQVLDRGIWTNVDFVNTHIVYRGGPVALNGVRFINCTFEVAGRSGDKVLRYVALDEESLSVRADEFKSPS